MNKLLSKEIYNELILGKYINEDVYSLESGTFVTNKLFVEIDKNINEYEDLYENIGYKLDSAEGYFYLIDESKDNDDNYINKVQLKEYVLLLSIFRYLQERNIPIENFANEHVGVQSKILDEMFETVKYGKLFEMSEINTKKPLQDVLMKQNIIFLNKKNNYCLNSVGKSFRDMILEEGKKINKEDS